MGHGPHLGKEHQALARRLQHGNVALVEPADPAAKAAWREILETLFTPDEAALAAKIPVIPSSLERIAARVGSDRDRVRADLDAMADKGLVLDLPDGRTGETMYMLAPPVVGFFEFSMMRLADHLPKAKLAKAFDAYWRDPSFLEEVTHGDTVIGRALAHESALFDGLLSEVLDWERAGALVERAGRVSVTNCYCRHKAHHLGQGCENPLEICMSVGAAADYLVRHGLAREITRDEGLDILAAGREAGLVHIADNLRNDVSYICSCCSCCCEELESVRRDLSVVVPSGFQPRGRPPDLQRLRSLPARLSGRRHLTRLPAERLRRPGRPGRPAGGGRRSRSLHRLRGVRRFLPACSAAARTPPRTEVRSRELGRVRRQKHDGAGQGGRSAYRRHHRARTGVRQRGGPDYPLLASRGSPDSERAGPLAIRAVRAVKGRASALEQLSPFPAGRREAPGLTADLLRRRRRRSSNHPEVGIP